MSSLFQQQAAAYRKYRPVYTEALYQWLLPQVPGHQLAWDVGTGNGQVAAHLAQDFTQVHATDLAEKQLAQAPRAPNIQYLAAPAEASGLPDQSVDLVTVAQAAHWFDLPAFYQEVLRVAKPGAILAIWGYDLPVFPYPALNQVLRDFYANTLGSYWDAARRHIDTHYQGLHFPFDQIPAPAFQIEAVWTAENVVGYVSSWSALQTAQQQGQDVLPTFAESMTSAWPQHQRLTVHFPIFLLATRL